MNYYRTVEDRIIVLRFYGEGKVRSFKRRGSIEDFKQINFAAADDGAGTFKFEGGGIYIHIDYRVGSKLVGVKYFGKILKDFSMSLEFENHAEGRTGEVIYHRYEEEMISEENIFHKNETIKIYPSVNLYPDSSIYYLVEKFDVNVLRFYPDGTVLGGGYVGKFDNLDPILKWRNKETIDNYRRGTYEFNGESIFFDLLSENDFLRYYGKLDKNNTLYLIEESLVTGYKARTTFLSYNNSRIKIPGDIPAKSLVEPFSANSLPETKTITASKPPASAKSTVPTNNHSNSIKKFFIITFLLFFLFTCATRRRVGATCWDGSSSGATGRGACSHHGGVMFWEHKYWWEQVNY